MLDDTKTAALGNIRKMLRDGKGKRLSGLVPKPAAPAALEEAKKPASLEVHVIKADAPAAEGSAEEEKDESPAEAAAEGDAPAAAAPHPLHALVMKKMDQILKPKKG